MKKEKPDADTMIKSDKQQEDPAVERGRKAIEAARMVNPQPDDEQERLEKEDAERWRNEG
jgi:hypothetical protein